MLARVFALVLRAPSAVLATSYSFRTLPTGPLSGPVRFEFRAESTAGAKRDVTSLTVSKRTLDHTWKPVWSISGKALGTIATCLAILAFVAAITDKTANVSGNDW